jgi:hypothetical protein
MAAARAAGMERQALGDTIKRYNAEGLEGVFDRAKPGRPRKLDASLCSLPDYELHQFINGTSADARYRCDRRDRASQASLVRRHFLRRALIVGHRPSSHK